MFDRGSGSMVSLAIAAAAAGAIFSTSVTTTLAQAPATPAPPAVASGALSHNDAPVGAPAGRIKGPNGART